jgi:hypothetical protein
MHRKVQSGRSPEDFAAFQQSRRDAQAARQTKIVARAGGPEALADRPKLATRLQRAVERLDSKLDKQAARYAKRHPADDGQEEPDRTDVQPPPVDLPAEDLAKPLATSAPPAGGGGYFGGDEELPELPAAPALPLAAAKPFKLKTRTKWLLAGGAVAAVGAGYVYYQYRIYTAPLRKYQRVKGFVQSIIGEFKGKR